MVILVACFVTSCDDQSNLQKIHQPITRLKQPFFIFKKKDSLHLLIPKPEIYQDNSGREPFDAIDRSQFPSALLDRYPLEQLKLMATVNTTSPPWAFILAPNHKIYQVTLGEVVGDHQGKIIKIHADTIEIAETSEAGTRVISWNLSSTH